jgi:hypothetical protein
MCEDKQRAESNLAAVEEESPQHTNRRQRLGGTK